MVKKRRVPSVSDAIFGKPFGRSPKNPLDVSISSLSPSKTEKDSRRSFSPSQRKEILARQDNRCAKCGKKLGVSYHFHHVKAWSSGGKTTTKNGIALCGTCHEDVSHKERLKKADEKRTRKDTNPFSGLI